MKSFGALELSMHGTHVAELRLSRPDQLNAFDDQLVNELPDALTQLARDPSVRAVVWTSTGKHFSAGGDVETILAGHQDLDVLMRGVDDGRRLFRAFADFPKPLVAAAHGSSFGVCTSLIFTADAVVTAPEVKLADPHVHMGLVAGDGGCVAWPQSAGLNRAKRKLLWGEPLTGREAFDIGLATDLVDDPGKVRDVALDLGQRVAALPPLAVQLTKRTLNRVLAGATDRVLDTGFYLEALSNRSADAVEAVEAFKERREGRWTGQ